MITALELAVAIVLPWVAGYAWLAETGQGDRQGTALRTVAYGYILGVLLLTAAMRLSSMAGARWSFGGLCAVLVVIGFAALPMRKWLRARARATSPATPPAVTARPNPPVAEASPDPLALPVLAVLAAALIVVRFASLASEVLLQPLYAWDSWTQWATKAKVWSALHTMAPFVSYDQWLARVPGYVDTAPHYPGTVPLLQAWMALALGRFDDALVNLPWLAFFVALGCGVYGQLRTLGASRSWSVVVGYLVLSLPLLDTHVALAGYADLPVSATYALGVLSLVAWERSGNPMQLVYLALLVVVLPTLKVPGTIWAATLVFGFLVARFGVTRLRTLSIGVAVLAATSIVVAILFRHKLTGSLHGAGNADVVQPLLDNLFLFDNWHLLWYLLPTAVALGWRSAIGSMRGTSAALAAGIAFLAVVFTLTRAGAWVGDYTTVNRAILHLAPAALAFGAIAFRDWAIRREAGRVRTPADSAVETPSTG